MDIFQKALEFRFAGAAFAGRGTLEYRISELGRSRLRWLRSQSG